MNEPDPDFQWVIQENLAYWQESLTPGGEQPSNGVTPDLQGMAQAVRYGLSWPPAHLETARLLRLMHRPAERLGWWEEWLALCQHTLPLCPPEEWPLQVRLRNGQGVMLRRCGRWQEAAELHQEAAQLARKQGDPLLAAQAHYFWGQALDQGGKFQEAATYAQQALDAFAAQEPQSVWHAAGLTLRGDLARKLHDLGTAVQLLEQATALYRRFNNQKTELALALNNLALAYQAQEAWPAAAACYEQALGHLESTNSELAKSKVRCNYGVLFFAQKDYLRAELAFREADTLALRKSANLWLCGSLAQNLGNTLLKQGSLAEAEIHLQRADLLWQRLGDDYNLANTRETLGEVYAGWGQKAEALTLYDQALVLLEQPRFANWPPAQRLIAETHQRKDEL